eukprot:jgi/Mesvir1/17362/Mv08672-RA.1
MKELTIVSASEADGAAFVSFLQRYEGRPTDLEEALQVLSKKDRVRLCSGLRSQVEASFATLERLHALQPPGEAAEGTSPATGDHAFPQTMKDATAEVASNGGKPGEDAVESTSGVPMPAEECLPGHTGADSARLRAASVLQAAVIVFQFLLTGSKSALSADSPPPEDMAHSCRQLHSKLLALEAVDTGGGLQSRIAEMCEAWWHKELPERDEMINQTVPYLIARALERGKAVDIQRLHSMREALTRFDYDSECIGGLKDLLLRTAFAPPFLRLPAGRRFLSFLFSLHPQVVRELSTIIANQIPAGRKSVLDAYSEVLLRAWKNIVGPCLVELEQSCVQVLMRAAILASAPSLCAGIRRVLGGFHASKSHKGVDALLLRLYEPLLFRALVAASSRVRCNSVLVLADAFPLQDPDARHEETEVLLQTQLDHIKRLLMDDVPAVRVAAVQAATSILATYWEIIPSAATASFIKCLIEDLAHDSSSATVRAAVLQGLVLLLANARSHGVLKAGLPRLAPLLGDHVLAVRLAMLDVLIAVRGLRTIKFYDVVPLKDLVAALGAEGPVAGAKITKLLLPTYCPPAQEEASDRMLQLLLKHPRAGTAFCRHMVSQGATPEQAVALLGCLTDTVLQRSSAAAPVSGMCGRQDSTSPGQQVTGTLPGTEDDKRKGRKRRGHRGSPDDEPSPVSACEPASSGGLPTAGGGGGTRVAGGALTVGQQESLLGAIVQLAHALASVRGIRHDLLAQGAKSLETEDAREVDKENEEARGGRTVKKGAAMARGKPSGGRKGRRKGGKGDGDDGAGGAEDADAKVGPGVLPAELLFMLLSVAGTAASRAHVMRLAALLPPVDLPILAQHCGAALAVRDRELWDPRSGSTQEVAAMLDFVCKWGGLPDLVAALCYAMERQRATLDGDAGEAGHPAEGEDPAGGPRALTEKNTGDAGSRAQDRRGAGKASRGKRGRRVGGAGQGAGACDKGADGPGGADTAEAATAVSMRGVAAARYMELLLADATTREMLLRDLPSVTKLMAQLGPLAHRLLLRPAQALTRPRQGKGMSSLWGDDDISAMEAAGVVRATAKLAVHVLLLSRRQLAVMAADGTPEAMEPELQALADTAAKCVEDLCSWSMDALGRIMDVPAAAPTPSYAVPTDLSALFLEESPAPAPPPNKQRRWGSSDDPAADTVVVPCGLMDHSGGPAGERFNAREACKEGAQGHLPGKGGCAAPCRLCGACKGSSYPAEMIQVCVVMAGEVLALGLTQRPPCGSKEDAGATPITRVADRSLATCHASLLWLAGRLTCFLRHANGSRQQKGGAGAKHGSGSGGHGAAPGRPACNGGLGAKEDWESLASLLVHTVRVARIHEARRGGSWGGQGATVSHPGGSTSRNADAYLPACMETAAGIAQVMERLVALPPGWQQATVSKALGPWAVHLLALAVAAASHPGDTPPGAGTMPARNVPDAGTSNGPASSAMNTAATPDARGVSRGPARGGRLGDDLPGEDHPAAGHRPRNDGHVPGRQSPVVGSPADASDITSVGALATPLPAHMGAGGGYRGVEEGVVTDAGSRWLASMARWAWDEFGRADAVVVPWEVACQGDADDLPTGSQPPAQGGAPVTQAQGDSATNTGGQGQGPAAAGEGGVVQVPAGALDSAAPSPQEGIVAPARGDLPLHAPRPGDRVMLRLGGGSRDTFMGTVADASSQDAASVPAVPEGAIWADASPSGMSCDGDNGGVHRVVPVVLVRWDRHRHSHPDHTLGQDREGKTADASSRSSTMPDAAVPPPSQGLSWEYISTPVHRRPAATSDVLTAGTLRPCLLPQGKGGMRRGGAGGKGRAGGFDCTPCVTCGSAFDNSNSSDPSFILFCDGCDRAFHGDCAQPQLVHVPEGDWFCDSCQKSKAGDGGAATKPVCHAAGASTAHPARSARAHHLKEGNDSNKGSSDGSKDDPEDGPKEDGKASASFLSTITRTVAAASRSCSRSGKDAHADELRQLLRGVVEFVATRWQLGNAQEACGGLLLISRLLFHHEHRPGTRKALHARPPGGGAWPSWAQGVDIHRWAHEQLTDMRRQWGCHGAPAAVNETVTEAPLREPSLHPPGATISQVEVDPLETSRPAEVPLLPAGKADTLTSLPEMQAKKVFAVCAGILSCLLGGSCPPISRAGSSALLGGLAGSSMAQAQDLGGLQERCRCSAGQAGVLQIAGST